MSISTSHFPVYSMLDEISSNEREESSIPRLSVDMRRYRSGKNSSEDSSVSMRMVPRKRFSTELLHIYLLPPYDKNRRTYYITPVSWRQISSGKRSMRGNCIVDTWAWKICIPERKSWRTSDRIYVHRESWEDTRTPHVPQKTRTLAAIRMTLRWWYGCICCCGSWVPWRVRCHNWANHYMRYIYGGCPWHTSR